VNVSRSWGKGDDARHVDLGPGVEELAHHRRFGVPAGGRVHPAALFQHPQRDVGGDAVQPG
jgi:hypothetical protein